MVKLKVTLSKVSIRFEGGWSILNIFSPLLIDSSLLLRLASCSFVAEMNSRASPTATSELNGPWDAKSSTRLETVFLNSSAEWSNPVLNFSY